METLNSRFDVALNAFFNSKKHAADELGVTSGYISQLTATSQTQRGLSGEILMRLATRLQNLNMNWLFRGEGEMIEQNGTKPQPSGPAIEVQGEPTQSQIEQLTDYTLTVQPAELTARQRLMLQLACAHVLKENQGLHPLEYLSMATRAYLRLIVRFPDFNLVSLFDLEGALRLQL